MDTLYIVKSLKRLALMIVLASVVAPPAGMTSDAISQEQFEHVSWQRLGYSDLTHILFPRDNFDISLTTPSELYRAGYVKGNILHPYNPVDNRRDDVKPYLYGHAAVPLFMHLPARYQENLPDPIKNKIDQAAIQVVDIMVLYQNFPWTDGTVICARPQYRTEPNIQTSFKVLSTQPPVHIGRHIEVGVFSFNQDGVTLADRPPNTFHKYDISTHSEGTDNRCQLVLSRDQPQIRGLSTRGQSFWSYIGYTDDTGQKVALVTLQQVLSDAQYAILQPALDAELPRHGNKIQNLLNVVNLLQDTAEFNDGKGHIDQLVHLMGFISPRVVYHINSGNDTPCDLSTPGFSGAERTHRWTDAKKATLIVPLEPSFKTLSFVDTAGLISPNYPEQRLSYKFNGAAQGQYVYNQQHPTWTITTRIPKNTAMAICEFKIPKAITPKAIGLNTDTRELGILFRTVECGLQYVSSYKVRYFLGQDGSFPYKLMKGFSGAERTHRWTEGQSAIIEIPLDMLPNRRPYSIEFQNVQAYTSPEHTQRMTLRRNGHWINEYQFKEKAAPQKIEITIPMNLAGLARIEFELHNPISPAALKGAADTRILGLFLNEVIVQYLQ